jgi:hypothetical protein
MPCYEEHKIVASVVGGATALLFAADQSPLQMIAEVAGGVFMGGHAGTWADCIEPGISSYHRQEAHAIVPSLVGANLVFQNLASFQGSLRRTAAECFELAQKTPDPLQALVNFLAGLGLHFVAGAVPAVATGYLSHVALDACTPRGVPVLVRGL